MNLSFSVPSNFRENLLLANLDLEADTFEAVLMRPGFSFSSANHKYKKNIKAVTSAVALTCTASTKTFTRAAGSFIDDGWVVGSYLTGNSTNAGTYVVRAVTALTLRVDLVGSATFVDQSSTSQTLTSTDEMATITTGSINYTVTQSTSTFARESGSFVTDGFVVGTNFTSTSSTNPGPYQVESVTALSMVVSVVGNTAALTDETATSKVMSNGYVQNTTTPVTVTFDVSSSSSSALTLETSSFSWSEFGAALLDSPGIIIFDETATDDPIVAYARLTPWTLTF